MALHTKLRRLTLVSCVVSILFGCASHDVIHRGPSPNATLILHPAKVAALQERARSGDADAAMQLFDHYVLVKMRLLGNG